MRFLLTGRFFIIPFATAFLILFRYWVPGAVIICVVLNSVILILAALEYFLIPRPAALSIVRDLPEEFFLFQPDQVSLTIYTSLAFPLKAQLQDRPPTTFGIEDPRFKVTLARGHRETVCTYQVIPKRRGKFHFRQFGVRLSTRIGLVARQFTVASPQEARVYPSLKLDRKALLSRFYYLDAPNRAMRTYGPGNEFAQMREYKVGDDIRAVHWKRTARAGKMIVREFEPEKGQNVFLMLDGGRLMMSEYEGRSKVDWALSSSILLAEEALHKKDAVGMLCFSNQINTCIYPSSKKLQLNKLIQSTFWFQPQYLEPDYRGVFQHVYATLKQRSIIIVFTDFFDTYLSEELARHITFLKRRHKVICVVLTHPAMTDLGYRKTGSLLDATLSAVVRENLDNRRVVLKGLRRANVDIVDTQPDRLNGALLSAYMQARWN